MIDYRFACMMRLVIPCFGNLRSLLLNTKISALSWYGWLEINNPTFEFLPSHTPFSLTMTRIS